MKKNLIIVLNGFSVSWLFFSTEIGISQFIAFTLAMLTFVIDKSENSNNK
jgi:hypothetical protein